MIVYCRDCGWCQDDFWDKYNNPIVSIFDAIKFWIRPRFVVIDKGGNMVRIHSWILMMKDILAIIRSTRNMKWKTYKQFKADKHPTCPRCGSDRLIVD